MIEIEVNKNNLNKFIHDIRDEDIEELKQSFNSEWRNKFIEICLNEKYIWFLADNDKPFAIGGIQIEQNDKNAVKKGRIWLICAKSTPKNKVALIKYIKNKIDVFKEYIDILYNYIYKTNFNFLKYLKKIGFKTIAINSYTKFFYYIKEEL